MSFLKFHFSISNFEIINRFTGNWRSFRNSAISFSSFFENENELQFFTFVILKNEWPEDTRTRTIAVFWHAQQLLPFFCLFVCLFVFFHLVAWTWTLLYPLTLSSWSQSQTRGSLRKPFEVSFKRRYRNQCGLHRYRPKWSDNSIQSFPLC